MQTIKSFYKILLLILLGFASCSDSNNDSKQIEDIISILEIAPNALNFGHEGGTLELEIKSNTTWRINFDASSWCTPSLHTAKGNASVIFTAKEHSAEIARNQEITITAEGVSLVLKVAQEGNIAEVQKPEYIEPDNTGMRELTALQFSKLMMVGWNLGNSLEAINANNGDYTGNETSWGNPRVTKTLVDAVKNAGFNTIRIPVSWSHNLEDTESYVIKRAWKERVEEVVNYALDNDMFVMINIHWDGGWMNQPYNENKDAINNKLQILWKQIAIHFRDYDDRLLFAGTNEVHVDNDWGTPSSENVEVQNSFNQTFVNAIRATGGRNAYRQLIVQAYNTNIDLAMEHLKIPTDAIANRLMAEVHFYDPYDFALQEDGDFKTLWGKNYSGENISTWGQEAWVDEVFGKMKTKFVNQGVPVILGEYGALIRTSLSSGQAEHHDARNHYLSYVTKVAKVNGLVPVYWDNGHTGDNGFGLFERSTGKAVHQASIDAIMAGLK